MSKQNARLGSSFESWLDSEGIREEVVSSALNSLAAEDEFIRGSGNVYADVDMADAGLAQARAIVAARIISVLDRRSLSTRDAEKLTGVSHSEFSRIRNTQLRRFTLDRLILLLAKLEPGVEVSVSVKAGGAAAAHAA